MPTGSALSPNFRDLTLVSDPCIFLSLRNPSESYIWLARPRGVYWYRNSPPMHPPLLHIHNHTITQSRNHTIKHLPSPDIRDLHGFYRMRTLCNSCSRIEQKHSVWILVLSDFHPLEWVIVTESIHIATFRLFFTS